MRKMAVSRDCFRVHHCCREFLSLDKFEEKSYCGLAINAEINSDNLNQQLQAFWEIERVDESPLENGLEEKFVKPNIKTLIIALKKDAMLYNYPLKKIHTV
ncbi:hypothetical protein TNCV_4477501 [Trichonephila clavipes]|nr:hypothetical protein TNCV_4477501 [Trichonephila clavipes]